MNKWKDLSIQDKAKYIRESVRNGIFSLNDIQNRFDGESRSNWMEKVAENAQNFGATFKNYGDFEVPYRTIYDFKTLYTTKNLTDWVKDREQQRTLDAINTIKISPEQLRLYKLIGTEVPQKFSDNEVVESYVKNALWKMENPDNKGYNPRTKLYYSYKDKDASGKIHENIGPGLEKNGHPNIDYSKGYTKKQLDDIAAQDNLKNMQKISKSLSTMEEGKYSKVRDTLSMGPLMTLLDIAYNVKPKQSGNLPEKWPNLIKALSVGNLEGAKKQTYSGSTRRQDMRNDLLVYGKIDENTVTNR